MDPLHQELAAFLRERRLRRDVPMLVAVSGGADSMALLHAMCALGQRVGAAHVHHGLRGAEADADLAFLREAAQRLGLPLHVAFVAADAADGRSPEARARELRYAHLERIRAASGYAWIATAHTLEDQAETVLLRAVRGSTPAGLASIMPIAPELRLIRPVLGARRADLRAYLGGRGLSWREDSSNADPQIPRNRLRRDVLPVLEELHPGATRKLAELAEAAREHVEGSRDFIENLVAQCAAPGDGGTWLDNDRLAHWEPATRRSVLRQILELNGVAVTRRHLLRVDAFLDSGSGASLSLPGGFALVRDRCEAWLGPQPGPRFQALGVDLRPPETLELAEWDWRLTWVQPHATDSRREGWIIDGTADAAVRVRSPAAGDVILTVPGAPPRHLKDLFQRARWSRRQRARALVIEAGGEVVWIPGLARRAATPSASSAGRGSWKLLAERLSTC